MSSSQPNLPGDKGFLWEDINRDTALSKGDKVRHTYKFSVPDVVGDPDENIRQLIEKEGVEQDLTESANQQLGEGKSIKVLSTQFFPAGQSESVFTVTYKVTASEGTLTPTTVKPGGLGDINAPVPGISLKLTRIQRYDQGRLLMAGGGLLVLAIAAGVISLN